MKFNSLIDGGKNLNFGIGKPKFNKFYEKKITSSSTPEGNLLLENGDDLYLETVNTLTLLLEETT